MRREQIEQMLMVYGGELIEQEDDYLLFGGEEFDYEASFKKDDDVDDFLSDIEAPRTARQHRRSSNSISVYFTLPS